MTNITEPKVIGLYPYAEHERVLFVELHDWIYPLTVCCGASAKGSDIGTVCRSCYQEISSLMGMCWTHEEFAREFGLPKEIEEEVALD